MSVLVKLQPVIDRHLTAKFSWGENDCVLFTARCLDAIHEGADFECFVNERYPYQGPMSAQRIIQTAGGLEILITHALGSDPVPWAQLVSGDVVLGRAIDRDALLLGIQYNHHFLTMGPNGMVSLPMDFAIKGWRCADGIRCNW